MMYSSFPKPVLTAAYADPPYLGCGKLYAKHHPDALEWDDPKRHQRLIDELCGEFDCWAMSLSSPSLKTILPMCPPLCRVGAWVKPFAVFKPNVGVAYTWEPVVFYGGRKRGRHQPTIPDFLSENITLKKGLTGAKPPKFCRWIIDVLNLHATDQLTDLFPGTGAMGREWERFKNRSVQTPLVLEG